MIDRDTALASAEQHGDDWQKWRATRLVAGGHGEPPALPTQDDEGGFFGPTGRVSPGATGEALCHLTTIGLGDSGPAAIAADWLYEARTPAQAWLDSPDDVPGEIEGPGAGRVWATVTAALGLLVMGRDPGARALTLVRREADSEGRFTGGAYPTFAAAAAYWIAEGPQTETAEWALRWTREWSEDWWGPWEWVTALTFWGAAGIPADHPSVEAFLDALLEAAPEQGWPNDAELTLRTLEVIAALGDD